MSETLRTQQKEKRNKMGLLSGAMPRQSFSDNEPTVKSEKGSYRAYFIGMTEPYEEIGKYGNRCRLCKGTRKDKNGKECFACGGDGLRHETYVKLRYELENGNIEEEEVTFKLSPPGTGKDGSPLSASTLFLRMREFANMQKADAATLDAWYSSLTTVKVPITVNIGYNNGETPKLKITDVQYRNSGAKRPPAAQPPPPPAPVESASSFDDDDLPF